MMMMAVVVVRRHQNRPVNVDDVDYFYSQSANERLPCDALPDMNLQAWAEAPPASPVHPTHVDPREAAAAAALLPVAAKTARTAVEQFVDEVAPARRRRGPVFREHGHRAGA